MSACSMSDDLDDDWGDEGDLGDETDGDDEPTVSCPACRREILEDTPRCPWCGRYVSATDHTGRKRPLWVLATALACLAMALWWALMPR